jgi:hypothetical protein
MTRPYVSLTARGQSALAAAASEKDAVGGGQQPVVAP